MSQPLLDAIEGRRSYYGLTKKMPITADRVTGARAVILLDDKSVELWSNISPVMYGGLGGDGNPHAQVLMKAIELHRKGQGTIVFFEDSTPVDAVLAKMPT